MREPLLCPLFPINLESTVRYWFMLQIYARFSEDAERSYLFPSCYQSAQSVGKISKVRNKEGEEENALLDDFSPHFSFSFPYSDICIPYLLKSLFLSFRYLQVWLSTAA